MTFEPFEEALRALDLPGRDEGFAQRVYASLCNVGWKTIDDSDSYTCSWRYAGGLVDGLRIQRPSGGDYMRFYCSGNEGRVDPEVEAILAGQGWVSCPSEEADLIGAGPEMEPFYRARLWLYHQHGSNWSQGPAWRLPPGSTYEDVDLVLGYRDDRSFLVTRQGEVYENLGGRWAPQGEGEPPRRGAKVYDAREDG